MLTSFGKFLRKLRIDRTELLKDMAEKLNASVAYLSAVENGKRDVPDKWLDIIREEYNLTNDDYDIMYKAAYEDKDTINLKIKNSSDRDIVLAFARKFDELTYDEKQNIFRALDSNK